MVVQIKKSNLNNGKPIIDLNVWLCDLTYTQQSIAADTIPMAIGCIATYVEDRFEFNQPVRLFKYPEKLCLALDEGPIPDIIGFSNYCWNSTLSLEFAKVIRKYSPKTVIVFGGPHYPIDSFEQEVFLTKRPEIDFYIPKEGEVAFADLVEELWQNNLNINKAKLKELKSVHCISENGSAQLPPFVNRLTSLDDIPSPYTTGKLDEFFDGRLMPLLQTNRGCPFTCTFCVEGVSYYSKVRKNTTNKVVNEIEYMGLKMSQVEGDITRNDLFIADSNFGMYPNDIDTCKAIRRGRDKYSWPEYINVATGKNRKERVIEAARILDGGLRLSGSVQSLDEGVLDKVKRKNISTEQLMDLGLEAKKAGVNSYSEIILGLPGDSKDAHFSTIRKIMDAGFNIILPWQLMILPGSQMGTEESIKEFGMVLRHRVLPRCFGHFSTLGEDIICAEIEEVCVANNTLSFEDYLECRRLNLFVAIFYNDGIFSSLLKLFRILEVSPFKWIQIMMETNLKSGLDTIISEFKQATTEELWNKRNELDEYTRDSKVIQKYIDGELGRNNLFYFRTLAITQQIEALSELARSATLTLLAEELKDSPFLIKFVDDALDFNTAKLSNIFIDNEVIPEVSLTYDIELFENEMDPTSVEKYNFGNDRAYKFMHTDEQKKSIKNYSKVFGSGNVGLARIMARVYVKKLYRSPVPIN
jgi:radical SAM superfamily enzyme YgiQ (UPF0313 family)